MSFCKACFGFHQVSCFDGGYTLIRAAKPLEDQRFVFVHARRIALRVFPSGAKAEFPRTAHLSGSLIHELARVAYPIPSMLVLVAARRTRQVAVLLGSARHMLRQDS